jgi:MYXO-CTERM domain-containing protein
MRKALFLLASLAVLGLSTAAFAAWEVRGSTSELGNWTAGSGALLYDDGTHGDVASGDSIFTAEVTFASAGDVWYKVFDTTAAEDYSAGLGTSADGDTIMVTVPAGAVTFIFDTRTLTGWLPATQSVADSVNAEGAWIAVGTFQSEECTGADWNLSSTCSVAYDDGTHGDAVSGDHIYTYQFTATAAHTAAEFMFAVSGGASAVYSADGWNHATTTGSAAGTFTAAIGDEVTLELDALHGHIRATVVPATPGVASIVVEPATDSIQVDSTAQFSATALDSGGNVVAGVNFDWSTSDGDIASIDPVSGLATGLGVGEVTVIVRPRGETTPEGTATLTVTVHTYNATGMVMGAGGSPLPGVEMAVEDHDEIEPVVTGLDGTYLIEGLAPGNYQIKATRDGFRTVTQPITIEDQDVVKDFALESTLSAPNACGCQAGGAAGTSGALLAALGLAGLLLVRRRRS